MIQAEVWCKRHSSPRRVAADALSRELVIDLTDDGGMAFHCCAECLADAMGVAW
jgi:hypothetical protein